MRSQQHVFTSDFPTSPFASTNFLSPLNSPNDIIRCRLALFPPGERERWLMGWWRAIVQREYRPIENVGPNRNELRLFTITLHLFWWNANIGTILPYWFLYVRSGFCRFLSVRFRLATVYLHLTIDGIRIVRIMCEGRLNVRNGGCLEVATWEIF